MDNIFDCGQLCKACGDLRPKNASVQRNYDTFSFAVFVLPRVPYALFRNDLVTIDFGLKTNVAMKQMS